MIRKLEVNLFLLWQHFILKGQNIFHVFHKETHSELCACCVAIASSVCISKHDSNKTLNGKKTKSPFINRNVRIRSQSVQLPRWRCHLRQGSSGLIRPV